MQIRVKESGAVMYEDEFRRLHTGLGLPKVLTEAIINEWGGDIVFEGPQATTTPPYEFSYRSGVVQDDQGRWFTKYSAGPVFADQPATDTEPAKTAAEQMAEYKARMDEEQARRIRADRNTRLNDSDWSQLADSTADKAAWATYRQALRDITTQTGFPWTITWPTQP